MTKTIGVKTLVACAALTAASAFAQTTGSTSGWSLGASVGGSHWKGNDEGGLVTDPSDTGGKLFGGYQFTPNFGLEGGYVNFGKWTGPAGDLKADGLYLDAVGTVPLANSGFSLLGRVGAFNGRLRENVTDIGSDRDRGTNVKYGLGVQYGLNANLGIRTEWERYRFDALDVKGNTDMYSVGLNYRF